MFSISSVQLLLTTSNSMTGIIREDFLLINQRGLYCKYGDFYIDPKEPVSKAIISHAHADHAASGIRTYIAQKLPGCLCSCVTVKVPAK